MIKQESSAEKPIWLPQMKTELPYVKNELDKHGVGYEMVQIEPKELIPLQQNVKKNKVDYFKDKINNDSPLEPICITNDNEILDGHHRAYAFMADPSVKSIVCLKVCLNKNDAARILNKIQDKFDFEQNFNPEKDDILTFDNIRDSFKTNITDETPSEDLMTFDTVRNNPKTLTLYKNQPINTKSKTGDFLSINPSKNFSHKYVISFNNLLEISEEDLKKYNSPIQHLVEKWFSGRNLKEESVKNALTQEIHTYRSVNEMAKKRGYDGIQYGNKFVQTINE